MRLKTKLSLVCTAIAVLMAAIAAAYVLPTVTGMERPRNFDVP